MSTSSYLNKGEVAAADTTRRTFVETLHATPRAEETLTVADARKARYAAAARRMRRGKQLVIGGFVVAVVGMVGYCLACFAAGANESLGAALLQSPGWLIGPTLAVLGAGTLLWLAGSFLYLIGGMESDPEGPDLFF